MRAILLVPVMLAALAAAVFLGLGGRTVSGCEPAARPRHSASEPGRPRACLPVRQPLAYQRVPGGWLQRQPGGRTTTECGGPVAPMGSNPHSDPAAMV